MNSSTKSPAVPRGTARAARRSNIHAFRNLRTYLRTKSQSLRSTRSRNNGF